MLKSCQIVKIKPNSSVFQMFQLYYKNISKFSLFLIVLNSNRYLFLKKRGEILIIKFVNSKGVLY